MPADGYKTIEQLLKDRIGLEPSALGPKAVEQAVAERMLRLGIDTIPSYAALILNSMEEFEALIELVVIPETWFFRDREPFVFLAHFIRAEWKPLHAKDTLRILSAPCATGEEPYSIAMTCLDCGLKQKQFAVDAADINGKFLDKARKAVYGRNSFRGTDPAFRERYFTASGHEYSLKQEVRAAVRFFKANLLAPDSLPGAAHYNIIFCRNLLIYLHDQARLKTIAIIESLLAPGGLLFIGHAEINPALLETYETVKHQGSFALRRPVLKQDKAFLPAADQIIELCPLPPGSASAAQPAAKAEPVIPEPPTITRSEASERASAAPENIEYATMLANEGRLNEAADLCRQIIQADKRSAQAHFLMGLINEARDDNGRAEECFNRAVYLDANFTEAILHLAALKEQDGDKAGADLLRRRAETADHSERERKHSHHAAHEVF